jgi:L,D-transpeptidase YcbB
MTRNWLLRSVAFAALAACGLGHANAQSAQEFWRQEWQRQHAAPQQPQIQSRGSGAYAYASGNWGAPEQSYQRDWSPFGGSRSYSRESSREAERSRSRPGPQVHVDNPDFLNYTPDRPQSASLAKACQFKIDGDGKGAPNGDFAQACTATPAISMKMLPDVANALTAYYSAHPQFIWVQDGKIGPRALAAIAQLGAADKYGLNPADYKVALPQLPDDESARQQALLRFELALSAKVLTYTLDATRGRIDPNRISGYHDLPRKSVDLVGALSDIAKSDDVAAAIAARNPDNPQFKALLAELERLRGTEPETKQPVASKRPVALTKTIRPGDDSPVLPDIVADLKLASPAVGEKYAAALDQAGTKYTGDVVDAVRAFQKEKGIKADGRIRQSTIAALTGGEKESSRGQRGSADKIQKIEIALEELRWLPREFPKSYIFLNEPAFEVTYFNDGTPQLSMRAVVGKPTAQTYFFVDHVKDVEYNPYWNVPRSIVINEMLPHLYRDPGYLDSKGYEVANQKGRQIASNSVNWAAVASDKSSVEVRQPPGDRNALGKLKIEFPNKHAIYLHDTPEKSFFGRDMRALSHGCVRLQHPREMAAAVLGTTVEHVDKRIASHKTDKELVKRDLPIYLVYFTAWPDQNGNVKYYNDVYERDAHVKLALQKTEAERKAE